MAAAASASEAARAEEQRRTAAQQEVSRNATLALDQARADAARAADAARGLRGAAAAAAARCDRGPGNPATAGSGPAAADTGAVLADVLVGMDAAGRAVAALADARSIALDACVSAYRALTP